MHVFLRTPDDTDRLRELITNERDAKQRDRYRVALLALDPVHETESIMTMLHRSRGFVQR